MGLFDSWSVEDYKISFTNPIVKVGDVISGNVTFTVKSEMSFRSVTLKVMGKERTQVTVTIMPTSGDDIPQRHTYKEHRNLFKVHLTLLGAVKKQGSWDGKLAPGQYNFPFAVRIPMDAMPTYASALDSGTHGGTQWFAKTTIDIPFSVSNKSIVADFNVVTAMPMAQLLSGQPYFSNRASMPRIFCCCCRDGYTQIMFNLERSLFAFGHDQQLRGSATVNNEASEASTEEIKVVLSRNYTFAAEGRTRVASAVIAKQIIPTNLPPKAIGDKTFQFALDLPTNDPQNVSAFKGAYTSLCYELIISCNGDTLGIVNLIAGGSVDPTNQALPIGVENVQGQAVPKGQYPKFLYAPPPGAQATIPPQPAPVGPFSLTNNVPLFPYAAAAPQRDLNVYAPVQKQDEML